MMYNNKLVAAIKSKGKILREFGDTVYIPFGSEYSILIKNLHTVRAVVHINIDDTDVVPGGLVVQPKQEIDLERWIKNGNLTEGNRFKFIERTGNIENYRGIGACDGLVQIEFQFEQDFPRPRIAFPSPANNISIDSVYRAKSLDLPPTSNNVSYISNVSATSAVYDSHNGSATVNDIGITVPGSKSTQQFSISSWFPTEMTKHSIVLKLLGETEENKKIRNPVTVKHKPKCQTCGKQNKATAKFCSECGTSLKIFA